jgi:hypothetical protein
VPSGTKSERNNGNENPFDKYSSAWYHVHNAHSTRHLTHRKGMNNT